MRKFLVILVIVAGAIFADWETLYMGGGDRGAIQLNGRNDDTLRMYACGPNLYEYTWRDAIWDGKAIITLPAEGYAIAGEDVRGDSVNRIYVGVNNFYSDSTKLLEYEWKDTIWVMTMIDSLEDAIWNIVIGDGRNDGKLRLYVSYCGGFKEYTYGNGNWVCESVDTTQYPYGIYIGDVIGEGRNRIYVASWYDSIFEYNYNGIDWDRKTIFYSTLDLEAVTPGYGRNDDTLRLYTSDDWGRIFELTYNGTDWDSKRLTLIGDSASGGYVYDIEIADLYGNGKNRLYAMNGYGGGLYEIAFNGVGWDTSFMFPYVGENLLAVDGRGDGKTRLYVCSGGLREVSYIPQGIEERKISEKIPSFIAYKYFSFSFPGEYKVEIYDISGRKTGSLEGRGEMHWGGKAPAGIYFIRISTREGNRIEKGLLLK